MYKTYGLRTLEICLLFCAYMYAVQVRILCMYTVTILECCYLLFCSTVVVTAGTVCSLSVIVTATTKIQLHVDRFLGYCTRMAKSSFAMFRLQLWQSSSGNAEVAKIPAGTVCFAYIYMYIYMYDVYMYMYIHIQGIYTYMYMYFACMHVHVYVHKLHVYMLCICIHMIHDTRERLFFTCGIMHVNDFILQSKLE